MDEIPFEPNAFYIFDKGYYDLARLYRIQRIGSMFIIRAKEHLKYEIVSGDDLLDGDDNIMLDQTIRLKDPLTKKKYPSEIRRIVYYALELKRTFTFLTNDFTIKAKDIAMLYKQRWQVDKIASSRAFLLGNQRERCENTDICCSLHILPRGHRRTRLSAWKNNVQCPQSSEQSLDRQDPHQRPFKGSGTIEDADDETVQFQFEFKF